MARRGRVWCRCCAAAPPTMHDCPDMSATLRCILVGEGALIVPCAEALLDRGHEVVAVVTSEPTVSRWARERAITLAPFEALDATLERAEADVLFSVVNLRMVPAETLEKVPRAINFHDGPLPRYAGLNTTTWALLAGEDAHGVTWHEMLAGPDRGRILVQREVPIEAGDTSFSLNARCFDAGIATFRELAQQLTDDTLAPREQDLGERTYFARDRRPAAACFVDFGAPTEEVCRFVRALDFGSWENPLGWPHVALGNVTLCPRDAAPADGSGEAGVVLSVAAGSVVVATADGAVALSGWRRPCGAPFDPGSLATVGFAPGVSLALDASVRDTLATRYEEAVPGERVVRRRLARPAPARLSLLDRAPAGDARVTQPLSLTTSGWDAATRFVAFLARLGAGETFDIGMRPKAWRDATDGLPDLFASGAPARVSMPLDVPIDEAIACACSAFAEGEALRPWARDLLTRSPELADVPRPGGEPVWDVEVVEAPSAPLRAGLAFVIDGDGVRLDADAARVDATRLADWAARFERFDRALDGAACLRDISLLSDEEAAQLATWNDTAVEVDLDGSIADLIAERSRLHPDRTAAVCGGVSLTFAELDASANRLAHHLRGVGVGPGALVGISLERSVDLLVAALGIWRAGGAYVPLDPAYPAERVAFMTTDAGVDVVVSQADVADAFPVEGRLLVCLDRDAPSLQRRPSTPPDVAVSGEDLAYVIYTSGSTGTPKGVMVEHRQMRNFFAGMDPVVKPPQEPGAWLAVTSLNFDISVLELFYTLSRGFTVVVYVDEHDEVPIAGLQHAHRPIDFGLFYFSSDESEHDQNKYRLLLEGAKYGDRNGFSSVWTPERHFHAFGGLYPNPAVTGAAVAAVTENVSIRAGSCVTPLHHPIRVAEEWSVVDCLSNGRVGLSIAAGWQPNDFVLRPENFADRKAQMFRDLETIRALWRGETVSFPDGDGKPVEVRTLPRPVQDDLPYWVTAAGNPETFRMAGESGANILTHLLGQSLEEVTEKIAIYREARRKAGHAGRGIVSLMLHTMVGDNDDVVREQVRAPMKGYLRSAMNLVKAAAWSFPTFKKTTTMEDGTFSVDHLGEDELDALLDYAFERYHETSGLFGSVETCVRFVDEVKGCDVDEIACLIDFGVPTEIALAHLPQLADVLRRANAHVPSDRKDAELDFPELIERHGVTHLQCVPSMARLLLADPRRREALGRLDRMLVGGEAFPAPVARDLATLLPGGVVNVYGPTETTVWSTAHEVGDVGDSVPIGRPIANTEIVIVDAAGQLAPPGELGELCIAGAGVVRGYLDREELTAERFVPHPSDPERRMYRTGDLARFGADGVLEYHGRLDHQVKLRGHRIELGEIEARLLSHDAVDAACVVLREDTPGDQRLVAYAVAPGQPTTDVLRRHLSQTLPDYMLPSVFVSLSALPTTPNGKIDRAALPRPDAQVARVKTAYVEPEGELEGQIAQIWREVLQVDRVGMDDNFFDLGGHSLLTIQVHGQLQPVLPKPISLVDLFRFPTVRTLAAHVTGAGDGDKAVEEGANRASARKKAMASRRRGRRGS